MTRHVLNHIESATRQWRKLTPPILSTSHCEFIVVPVCSPTLKKASPWYQLLIYSTNSTFIVSIIVYLKVVQIVFTGFGYGHYKGLPFINNIFTLVSFFLVCLFLSCSLHTFFVGRSIFSNSFCAFTCLSNNSLISWRISTKLGSALPPCMLYLSCYFQPKENTWMYLWKVIALQVHFSITWAPSKWFA